MDATEAGGLELRLELWATPRFTPKRPAVTHTTATATVRY
jgi:hypothetical protein